MESGKVICPKCNSEDHQTLSEDGDRRYCTSCKHVWSVGGKKKYEETVDFKGAADAQKLVKLISDNLDLSKEIRATLMAQFMNAVYESWYDGFKAGLIADIIHDKELTHGKSRDKSGTPDRECGDGNRCLGEQDGKNGSAESGARKAEPSFNRIKEEVAGVRIVRPSSMEITEKEYETIAYNISLMDKVERVEITGSSLIYTLKR